MATTPTGGSKWAGSSSRAQARAELYAMVEVEEERLRQRRTEIDRVKELLLTVNSGAATAQGVAFEPIHPEHASAVISRLLRESVGVLRSLVLVPDDGPALEELTMRGYEERMKAGHEHRTLYPTSVLDSPSSVHWVQLWAGVGERQRLLPTIASEFAVFGTTAVVALARWGEPQAGYVVSRDPLIIDLHRAYFDQLWGRAHPLNVTRGEARSDERLLELLGMGLKDEAIARVMSLGLRTVRRRISALMTVHGVDNRYQLGLAIGRSDSTAR